MSPDAVKKNPELPHTIPDSPPPPNPRNSTSQKHRRMPARNDRTATSDYRVRAERGLADISRTLKRAGHPTPLGDPLSGIFILLESPVGPRMQEAITLSLEAIEHPDAYVTSTETGLLNRELKLAEPRIIAAAGPRAAREIDDLEHPLKLKNFSDAKPGIPFAYKRNSTGLLLPSLAPALDDEPRKRLFWNAFLTLRKLA